MIVDLFAGGGGASLGIEWALGRSPDVAINHDRFALAMHAANHPHTTHLRGDVWSYAPRDVTQGKTVELLWASPTCTFFSKAKGGALDRKKATSVRSLAWVVHRWAREAQPRVIVVENVEAFRHWGPLLGNGKVCPLRKGRTFRNWVRKIEKAGYVVEWRELRGCDYGAPTSRNRLFIIARCDGEPIAWPTPTHGPKLKRYRSAAECIDWTLPVPSIFERTKTLAAPTLRRIARGVQKFVLTRDPFVVPTPELVAPTLIHRSNGERKGQAPRVYDIREPIGTLVAQGQKHALVCAFLEKAFGGRSSAGLDVRSPLSTITTVDHHRLVAVSARGDRREAVKAFLAKFHGVPIDQPQVQLPLGTIASGEHKWLVTVHGEQYEIADIGLRMLSPRELFRAQGFPDDYVIAPLVGDRPLSKTAQVRMVGNSVVPHLAAAIVAANIGNRTREIKAA